MEKKKELLLSKGTAKCFAGKESEKIWLLFENNEKNIYYNLDNKDRENEHKRKQTY